MTTLHGAAHRVLDRILDADHPVPDAIPPAGQTGQDSGQDGGQDGVPIAAAATALGLSVEAVRKRIRRGTLQASKVSGEWRIVLPAGLDGGQDDAIPAGQDGQDERSAGVQDGGRDAGQDAARTELVEQLRGEVAWLREETARLHRRLKESETAQAEMRRLLLAHAPAARALPAGEASGPPEQVPQHVPSSPPRRSWWRRLIFRAE